MPRVHTPRPLLLLAGALAVACTAGPTGLCACSPAPDEALVYGRVTLPGGGPAAGVTVRGEIGPRGCEPWVDGWQATTGADGGYRLAVYRDGGYGYGPDACQHVFAAAPNGSGLRGSDTLPFVVRFRGGTVPDSVRMDLVLRAP